MTRPRPSTATISVTQPGATPTPDIGGFPLPARGVLAIGQAAWPILDHDEYNRTRD